MDCIDKMLKDLGYLERPRNAIGYFLHHVHATPDKIALHFPLSFQGKKVIKYKSLTFKQFHDDGLRIAQGLVNQGFVSGDRIILFFPVSVCLFQTIFACMYLGVVPIFIDSTMPVKKLKMAMKDAKAKAIISTKQLFQYRAILPVLWKMRCYDINNSSFMARDFSDLIANNVKISTPGVFDPNDTALISYTSGSTGRPKGANRTINVLMNQKIISETLWPHSDSDVDMPFFPMIVLQNLGCGVTSVIPAINYQSLDQSDAEVIVNQINDQNVTRFSAQPVIMEKLTKFIVEEKTEVPSLNSIVVGGAVVGRVLCQRMEKTLRHVDVNIVYGSTEVEPISHIKLDEIMKSSNQGLLVGKVIDVLHIKIEKIHRQHPWGEILLSGPHVIQEYIDYHPDNQSLKVMDENGVLWHRTGDIGFLDNEEKLWLLGRLKDQVEVLNKKVPTFYYEEELSQIRGVERVALIKSRKKKAIFLVKNKKFNLPKFLNRCEELYLDDYKIEFVNKIPVDKRHFSRVDRRRLREF